MSLQINPWKTLWTKPTATFATLISEAPGYNVLTLSILMGFGSALGQLSGSGLSLPQALGLTLLLGPVMGLGELFLGSWLLAQVGRWLGGQGEPLAIRTVMAWALTLVHNYQGLSQWCSGTQLLPLSSRGRLGWGFALRFNRQN